MKLNCLTISIISLVIFIAILYLINQNQNQNKFKFVENYVDIYDSTTERLEPLRTIILNARDNNDQNLLKTQSIDVKQLMCDDDNKNSSGLCLKEYIINHPKIII
jgi:hypothetical protein